MTVDLEHRCASPEEARALVAAVAPDDPAYVAVSVEGAMIRVRVRADSATSARATFEDLLAGFAVAERTHRSATAPR